ncbi:MAG: hypothetical protein JWP85_2446 [Rhodoglobus sp.]|nr:hypothetical protein [Rhodoglobus sp.]
MTETSGQQQSTFVGLLDIVAGRRKVDPELAARLTAVSQYLNQPDEADRPFLTVLLRTQGRRAEPFKDALLCLAAQTDEDFEVIVLEHDAIPEDARDVRRVLERLPERFAARVQLAEVNGGTRAKPLNVGVELARGRYIAVYDDDDLLFGNWVEEFKRTAGSGNRLLRAVVANQSVRPEMWPQDQDGFRTTSWPRPEYPDHFDLLQHLLVNFSPFMSWAFPRALFHTYGLRFDEELQVCEDWDVILRGSLLCGVDDVAALTSIYRRWEGGESSYTRHSSIDWRESEQRVIDRINESSITMPPGAMESMRRMVLYNTALDNYRFMFNGTSLRRPLNHLWDAARPGVKLAVKVRNRIRRLRRRRRDVQ